MSDKEHLFECNGLFCAGQVRSRCTIAIQVDHQAKRGSNHPAGPDVWPKNNWKSYTDAAEAAH